MGESGTLQYIFPLPMISNIYCKSRGADLQYVGSLGMRCLACLGVHRMTTPNDILENPEHAVW